MKILLATHHLDNLAGSELYVVNLARKLRSCGQEIVIFSFQLGRLSQILQQEDFLVTNDPEKLTSVSFDLAHVNHNITAMVIRSYFPALPIIQMVHGVLPFLERLPSIDVGISAYLAVSEEVRENLIKRHKIDAQRVIISRNFVDVNRFTSQSNIGHKPEKILVLSNHYHENIKNIIEPVCVDLGIEVFHVGIPENRVENVEDWINKADIVVTIGRGVIEAMACGRNVIVFDIHGMDGLVTPENYFELRKYNFSGRASGKMPTEAEFKIEILKYKQEYGEILQRLVEEEQSAQAAIDQLLEIYQKVSKEGPQRSKLSREEVGPELMYLEKEIGEWKARYSLQVEELIRVNGIVDEVNKAIQIEKEKIKKLEKKLALMKSSKFWKLRRWYIRFKNFLYMR